MNQCVVLCLAVALWSAARAGAQQGPTAKHEPVLEADTSSLLLDKGFTKLYELNFEGAREEFLEYQRIRPDDPMGKAAEAASYLYQQFDTKGILTSEFFLNDDRFLGGIEGTPAQNRNLPFEEAVHRSREMAKKRVKANSHDIQGLLVLTIADGMESNYDAFIQKKQMSALSFMKQGEQEANAVLAIDPTSQDAYVALGMANYVIGCLPSYKRAFLWFGGVHGDRLKGIQLMQTAADHGRYLSPFAKIMLALAYEREKQPEKARVLLAELSEQFPANRIFAHELVLVDQKQTCCKR
ncbi:MAG: hypothetical protein WB987_12935 [Candidatus Acidiferrales bacterium]